MDKFVDTIGKAIPGVTLDVFDSEYRSVEPNITGELVARGDNILLGYLDDEIATKKRIIDGWLHTGDLAQKLPNGYIRLLGRKDDLIKIGDHRVNPREIEKHIEENNKVSKVFVVPVSHELMGTAISLMVIPIRRDRNRCSFCILPEEPSRLPVPKRDTAHRPSPIERERENIQSIHHRGIQTCQS